MAARRIELTGRIYTRRALRQTTEAFADHCKASVTDAGDNYLLEIVVTEGYVIDEFLNYALALSAQEQLR